LEDENVANTNSPILSAAEYEQYAKKYMRSLPLEHFAEATGQSGQRAIALKSLSVLRAHRPEVQVFNELLVQYHPDRDARPHQVVPDNMVLVWHEPIKANLSFDLPLQPVGPLWVLDYLSKYTNRKDYEDHFHKYERELQVPYYLRIDTDDRQFTLYQHTGHEYVAVKPNPNGRVALPELDLEMGFLDKSVRYWHKDELLLLPAELLRELDKYRRLADEAKQRTDKAKEACLALERESERIRTKLHHEQNKHEKE
jgi:hypothetical protein